MGQERNNVIYFDEFGEQCRAEFALYEYNDLMELLFDKYMQEWGDCKGRAWCGTCHIKLIEGGVSEKIDEDEKNTLAKLGNVTAKSRLACQIPVTSGISSIVFKILKDDEIYD